MENKVLGTLLKARQLILAFAANRPYPHEEGGDRAWLEQYVNEFNEMSREVVNLNRQFIKELARIEADISDEDLLSMMINASIMYVTPFEKLNEKISALIDEVEKNCNCNCSCKDICSDDGK